MTESVMQDPTKQESIEQYFSRPDTPMAGSMVGVLMVEVLEKYPTLDFEQARAKAQELLNVASGKRIYRMPRVLSEAELAERVRMVNARFHRVPAAA